jgi:hypothetical protein
MIAHRIFAISFARGEVDCECHAVISEPADPAGDRDEGLVSAWNEHRRSVGAPVRSISGTIGKRLASGQRFALHLKALR